MNGKLITPDEIRKMISLRRSGHSLPEIMSITGRGSSGVFKHIKGVKVLPEYVSALRTKQGGSKRRADEAWVVAQTKARELIGSSLSKEQRFCLLLGIYWGEGNKKELSLINSDPGLIKTFIECLRDVGIEKDSLKISLRLYRGINISEAINFWSDFLSIDHEDILSVNVIAGKKTGRLKYGMCRVRVAKSAPYFKLLISLIEEVKKIFNAPVVQWIE